ncbi:MAG: caspase family protein [Desulfomonilaceae bacterium]|nr:caspase family protein [Desulfomonilaceae bacterium]
MPTTIKAMICLVLAMVLACPAHHEAAAGGKALLVGVENYPNPEFDLPGVRADVALIREVLIKGNMFKAEEIKVLIDEQATKRNIVKEFEDWLIAGTGPGDKALFYFSGHGVQIWDESGDEIDDGKDEALMAWDAVVPKGLSQRTFAGKKGAAFDSKEAREFLLDDEIHELLRRMKDRTVAFIIDACHSGTVHKSVNPRFVKHKTIMRPIVPKGVFEPRAASPPESRVSKGTSGIGSDLVAEGVRIVTFTAAEDSQLADVVYFDQFPKGWHSVFSWHLYHALTGLADLDGDGVITFQELADYVGRRVKEAGHPQRPTHRVFPKSLYELPFRGKAGVAKRALERPRQLACFLRTNSDEVEAKRAQIQSSISGKAKGILWKASQNGATCIVDLDKKDGRYGARLTDSSGRYWESHTSASLGEAIEKLLKNLRALYVQTSVAALRNPGRQIGLEAQYSLVGNPERMNGEVVSGDAMVFEARTDRPSYLLVFNVDTLGVIHPLYPGPDGRGAKLGTRETTKIGEDGSLTVQPPFGREMIVAVALDRSPESLIPFWKENDIGSAQSPWLTDQTAFLDALWDELAPSGTPRGPWTSRIWLLESFGSGK